MTDQNGENAKWKALTSVSHLIEKLFDSSLVGPALEELGLSIRDRMRLFRAKNLISISGKLDRILEEKNIDNSRRRTLSMSIGLPLLEKASYQDDDYLQDRWARLVASFITEGRDDEDLEFSLDKTYVEILDQFSRLDCELLEYLVENGIASRDADTGFMTANPIELEDVKSSFDGRLYHISLEKLVSLGCAVRVARTPFHDPEQQHRRVWADHSRYSPNTNRHKLVHFFFW